MAGLPHARDLAARLRAQLHNSSKKMFRKNRQVLLDIAITLEVADKVLHDTEMELGRVRAELAVARMYLEKERRP